jgi:hypothetical protein
VETVGVYEDGQPGEVFIANGRNKITRMAPAEYIGRYMPEWRDSPGTGHAGSSLTLTTERAFCRFLAVSYA